MVVQLTHLKETGSTNNYAMGVIKAGLAQHGKGWLAESQTAGKGQQGKVWVTEPGANIALSVILDTSWLSLADQFMISIAVAVATGEFFTGLMGDETRIKWPNDLYWRDRKAGGILIENYVKGDQLQWSISGTGININQVQFDPALKNPVSLRQITGKTHDVKLLGKQLANTIADYCERLKQHGIQPLLEKYNQLLYKKDEVIRLKKESAVFSCTLKEVTSKGEIIVEGAPKDMYAFGEVQMVV